jgi:hypothetical protein
VVVRQAHPGPGAPAHRNIDDKLRDAERYRAIEGVPWPVLVDDLDGTVHRTYGGLPDPTYLIDADGRVAFYGMVTHAPTLHRAIEALLARGGRGVVLGGTDRFPHALAAIADGWRALQRGAPQSVSDLMAAAPGAPLVAWLGSRLRPALAPVALRATPLPVTGQAGLRLAAGLTLFAGVLSALALRRRR